MKTKLYISLLAVLIIFFGCTKDYTDMNVNPNNPEPSATDPAMLLTYTLKHGGIGNADLHQRIHNIMVDTWAEYMIDLPANWNTDNFGFGGEAAWLNQYWNEFYTWINEVNLIIRDNSDKPDKKNVVQIARIWKVHMFLQATDLFGDMPYFKAADGSGIPSKYDSQDSIYYDMLKELKEAVNNLDGSLLVGSLATQDIIFNGDAAKWKKYGNSLRLRLAMRITEANSAIAKTNAEEAIAGGVLSEADADVGVPALTLRWGDTYPIPMYVGWGETEMPKGFYDLMEGLGGLTDTVWTAGSGDPRGPIYFSPKNGRLKAVAMGINTDNVSAADNPVNNSQPNTVTFTPSRKMCVMPVTEVLFNEAEAALKGWNVGGKTAQQLYEAGITYSMTQWGVSTANIAAYIASTAANAKGTSVAWNNNIAGAHNSQLEKIITQKFIAGFPDNGFEAWADHRRLLMPYLPAPIYADPSWGVTQYVSGEPTFANYIERVPYPSIEVLNDAANYEAVKAKDKITIPLWFTGR
jgi:hypothetical protein